MRATHDNRPRNDDEIDLRLLFSNIRRNWHYFLISLLVFGTAGLLYIRFTLPVFEANTSVLIKDSKNKSSNIEDILTGDLFGNVKNVATEIGILRSRSVLQETIEELGLGVSYYGKTTFFRYPIYKNNPFIVEPLFIQDGLYDEEFGIRLLDSTHFQLEIEADNRLVDDFNYSAKHRFGEEVQTPRFKLRVLRNEPAFQARQEDEYRFVVHSTNKLIAWYSEKMKAEPINKDATIVQISVQDQVPDRAVDFLNTLGKVYINQDVKDKSSVAALTLKFVDEQLEEISKTLNATELELQRFKEQKGTVDLSEESKAYLERVTRVDADRAKAELELNSLDYLYNYVKSNKDLDQLAPSSLGSPDPLLIDLIGQLKNLQSKRRSLRYGASENSPAIKLIDQQITETKASLIENINSLRNQTRVSLGTIKGQLAEYEGSIRKIPNIERELLGIQRNFSVNENIYLYLLQKKAETGIAKATAVSDNKVLDVASVNEIPVIPNRKAVAIITLLLALVLPVLFIALQGYLKNTVSNREDVEKHTKVPVIGVVGHHTSSERLVVSAKPKSAIAEAFRSIRANLMFLGLADQHKIVLITSSVGGEGKSFSTLNLAAVLALQHYRVIIVGMDLRKPQLVQDFGIDNSIGVSNYLIGRATLEEVIHKTSVDGLEIIPSGPVPPNPAELLANKRTLELLQELRTRYDYIIIDTPPVGIVSDALVLMNHADINVFIVRENYSKKEYLKTINEIQEQGKARQLCILLNDAGTNQRYGYGYGYSYGYHGYGYYDEEHGKKKLFRKTKKA